MVSLCVAQTVVSTHIRACSHTLYCYADHVRPWGFCVPHLKPTWVCTVCIDLHCRCCIQTVTWFEWGANRTHPSQPPRVRAVSTPYFCFRCTELAFNSKPAHDRVLAAGLTRLLHVLCNDRLMKYGWCNWDLAMPSLLRDFHLNSQCLAMLLAVCFIAFSPLLQAVFA